MSRDTDGVRSRVVVVTGAASGIGLGIAQHFARLGHRVAMMDRSADAVMKASQALKAQGFSTLPLTVDVSERGQVETAIHRVRHEYGRIEVSITCAGIADYSPFLELTPERWQQVIDINLTGQFNCIQTVLPDMVAAGWGRVVTISSMSAQVGAPNMVHYSASKGGVTSLTKAIAREFAAKGITANTIPPSIIDSGMSRSTEVEGKNPRIDAMVALVPVGRIGTPGDIAAACEWLCSDTAGFVTGQEINVNGGMYS